MGAGLLTIAIAAAQSPALASDTIVVTGERSNRSIRKTASSVEVFTAEKIRAEPGADRIDQLLEATANVTLGTTSLGPTIRGQNTTGVLQDLPAFLGGNRQRVTLQVDGRSVSYNEFVNAASPLWDVAQVEVFRSPQSTTQGRNSIAGAIFIETEDPTYDPEARVRFIYGDIRMGQFSGALSAPLVSRQLAVRLSGDLRKGRPDSKIRDRMAGADPDHDNHGQVRLKFLAEPDFAPSLRLETSLAYSKSKAPQVEGVRAPFEERRDPVPTYGVFDARTTSLTARADYRLSARLLSRTTLSYGNSRFQRFAPPGLGEAINKVEDWSVENVFHWRPDNAFELTMGAHHLRTNLDQSIDLTAVIGNGKFDDAQRSTGLFGEATLDPTPQVSLTVGLRFQEDSQRRVGEIGRSVFRLPLDYDESFAALLPKISVAYDVRPGITIGLLAQRAYNPGGATLNFETGDAEIFDQETAWSYEAFVRARVGRAHVRANLFRTDFRNAQRAQSRAYTVPGGSTAFWAEIENVPRSRSTGAEISIDWRAYEKLHITGGLGLLRTKITRTVDPANPINGMEFQRSPHVTASGSVSWRPVDRLTLSANVRYHSRYFSTDSNSSALMIGDNAVAHARIDWRVGPTTLFGYVRNVFDTFYMTHLTNTTFGTAVEPRKIGVGVEAIF